MNTNTYEAPRVECIEVEIEQGFAVSSVSVNDWGNGGSLGNREFE